MFSRRELKKRIDVWLTVICVSLCGDNKTKEKIFELKIF